MKKNLEMNSKSEKNLTTDDLKKVTGGTPPRNPFYKVVQNGGQVEYPF